MGRVRLAVALRICLLLALLGGLIYLSVFILQQNSTARTYLDRLQPAAVSLAHSSEALSKSTEQLLLVSDPPLTQDEAASRISSLRRLATDVRQDVAALDAAASTYQPAPYVPFADEIQRASLAHSRALDASSQLKEVLDEYDMLLAFLEVYYPNNIQFTGVLAQFNALTDLNLLGGSTLVLYGTATDIDTLSAQLRNVKPPRGLEPALAAAIAARERAASGFRALASGLSPPIDALIYGAAQEIEASTGDNEAANVLLDQRIEKSPIMLVVGELSEKSTGILP